MRNLFPLLFCMFFFVRASTEELTPVFSGEWYLNEESTKNWGFPPGSWDMRGNLQFTTLIKTYRISFTKDEMLLTFTVANMSHTAIYKIVHQTSSQLAAVNGEEKVMMVLLTSQKTDSFNLQDGSPFQLWFSRIKN